MRSLFLLALGVLCGAVATVLFFTLDTDFDAGNPDNAGGGNARILLDEEALSTLATRELRAVPGMPGDVVVKADVREEGLITFDVTVGALGVGLKSQITVDPEIVDGRLNLVVTEANLGELALPDELARLLEAPLQARLDALAGDVEYRLTAITTADNRLGLEVAV